VANGVAVGTFSKGVEEGALDDEDSLLDAPDDTENRPEDLFILLVNEHRQVRLADCL
jgi:hypothetical protein